MIAGCASDRAATPTLPFAQAITGSGEVQLKGWARLKGELMVYADRQSMRENLQYPSCISGVFSNHDPKRLAIYDGKAVRIRGKLFDFESLPEEEPILARKKLTNSVIPNFCYGKNVILITSISLTN